MALPSVRLLAWEAFRGSVCGGTSVVTPGSVAVSDTFKKAMWLARLSAASMIRSRLALPCTSSGRLPTELLVWYRGPFELGLLGNALSREVHLLIGESLYCGKYSGCGPSSNDGLYETCGHLVTSTS